MGMVVHWRRQPFDVYIGRPSKWGNPFSIGEKHGSRLEVIQKYEDWIFGRIVLSGRTPPTIEAIREELAGKVLGCWCAPLPCHGDVLSGIANADLDEVV